NPGGSERHSFRKHRRQTVAIAIGAHDAGRNQHRRTLNAPGDVALRAWAQQLDPSPESKVIDLAAQGLRERPGAYDLASELSAATGKDCARVDQVREPLFLDQAADRHDPWGTVFWRVVWEPLEIEAVVDALRVSCRATE